MIMQIRLLFNFKLLLLMRLPHCLSLYRIIQDLSIIVMYKSKINLSCNKYQQLQSQNMSAAEKQTYLNLNCFALNFYMNKIYRNSSTLDERDPSNESYKLDMPLPNNFQDFIMQQNNVYVDKSLFIKHVLTNENSIMLFHRPSKWGKTLNITMLNTFLNIQKEHSKIQKCKKLFQGANMNEKKIKTLKIYLQGHKFYTRYQGQYPVIFLNFGQLKFYRSYKIKKQIVKLIKNEYTKHSYLQENLQYQQNMRWLNKICSLNERQFSELDKKNIFLKEIAKLAKLLQLYHQKPHSYLLIDNYSQPIEHLYYEHSEYDEIETTADFISDLCIAFCIGNQHRKAILMGKLDVYSGWSSKFIRAEKYDILDFQFSDSFGFSRDQVQDLLLDSNLSREQLMNNIQQWYGGYLRLEQDQTKLKNYENLYTHLFQPFCVLAYLHTCNNLNKVLPGIRYQIENQSLLRFILSQARDELSNFVAIIDLICKNTDNQRNKCQIKFEKESKMLILKSAGKWNHFAANKFESIFQQYVIYLLLCHGFITGVCYRFAQIFDIYIPNKSFLFQLKFKLKQQIKSKGILKDFSYIQLSNKYHLKIKIEEALNEWKKNVNSDNQKTLSSIFFIRYALSDFPTHQAYMEQKSSNLKIEGWIDSIFYPKGSLSNTCFIHENKFHRKRIYQASLNDSLQLEQQLAFWQIFTKGYLNWALQRNDSQYEKHKIKNIVARCISFYQVQVQKSKELKAKISQMDFSLDEARAISRFFELEQVQIIIRIGDGNYGKIGRNILSLTKYNTLLLLLQQIKRLPEQQISQYVSKSKGERFIFDQKCCDFFQQIINIKGVNKLQFRRFSLMKIFKFSCQQLINYSFQDQKLTQQQAQHIKEQLQVLWNSDKIIDVRGMGPKKRIKKDNQTSKSKK